MTQRPRELFLKIYQGILSFPAFFKRSSTVRQKSLQCALEQIKKIELQLYKLQKKQQTILKYPREPVPPRRNKSPRFSHLIRSQEEEEEEEEEASDRRRRIGLFSCIDLFTRFERQVGQESVKRAGEATWCRNNGNEFSRGATGRILRSCKRGSRQMHRPDICSLV